MAQEFTVIEKYDMFVSYILCNKNPARARNNYFQNYPERRQPNIKTFVNLNKNLRECGAFSRKRNNRNNNRQINEDQEDLVIHCVQENANISTRQVESEVAVPKSSVSRILKKKQVSSIQIWCTSKTISG